MATTDTERYVRVTLLTFEGGIWISRTILFRELDLTTNSPEIDTMLGRQRTRLLHMRNKRVITKPQFEILFPPSGDNTNVDEWDLSLLIKVIKCCFETALSDNDKSDLDEILRIRNEVCHASHPSLEEHSFVTYWTQVTTTMSRLASTFKEDVQKVCTNMIQKLSRGPLDIQSSLEKLAQLCRNDEIMDHALDCLQRIEQTQTTIASGVVSANNKLDGANNKLDGANNKLDCANNKQDDILAQLRRLQKLIENGQLQADIPNEATDDITALWNSLVVEQSENDSLRRNEKEKDEATAELITSLFNTLAVEQSESESLRRNEKEKDEDTNDVITSLCTTLVVEQSKNESLRRNENDKDEATDDVITALCNLLVVEQSENDSLRRKKKEKDEATADVITALFNTLAVEQSESESLRRNEKEKEPLTTRTPADKQPRSTVNIEIQQDTHLDTSEETLLERNHDDVRRNENFNHSQVIYFRERPFRRRPAENNQRIRFEQPEGPLLERAYTVVPHNEPFNESLVTYFQERPLRRRHAEDHNQSFTFEHSEEPLLQRAYTVVPPNEQFSESPVTYFQERPFRRRPAEDHHQNFAFEKPEEPLLERANTVVQRYEQCYGSPERQSRRRPKDDLQSLRLEQSKGPWLERQIYVQRRDEYINNSSDVLHIRNPTAVRRNEQLNHFQDQGRVAEAVEGVTESLEDHTLECGAASEGEGTIHDALILYAETGFAMKKATEFRNDVTTILPHASIHLWDEFLIQGLPMFDLLSKAIETYRFIFILMTPDLNDDPFWRYVVKMCVMSSLPTYRVKVVPIWIDTERNKYPTSLSCIQGLNYHHWWSRDHGLKKLFIAKCTALIERGRKEIIISKMTTILYNESESFAKTAISDEENIADFENADTVDVKQASPMQETADLRGYISANTTTDNLNPDEYLTRISINPSSTTPRTIVSTATTPRTIVSTANSLDPDERQSGLLVTSDSFAKTAISDEENIADFERADTVDVKQANPMQETADLRGYISANTTTDVWTNFSSVIEDYYTRWAEIKKERVSHVDLFHFEPGSVGKMGFTNKQQFQEERKTAITSSREIVGRALRMLGDGAERSVNRYVAFRAMIAASAELEVLVGGVPDITPYSKRQETARAKLRQQMLEWSVSLLVQKASSIIEIHGGWIAMLGHVRRSPGIITLAAEAGLVVYIGYKLFQT